eukprot:4872872-Amphidinium_carterae.2
MQQFHRKSTARRQPTSHLHSVIDSTHIKGVEWEATLSGKLLQLSQRDMLITLGTVKEDAWLKCPIGIPSLRLES